MAKGKPVEDDLEDDLEDEEEPEDLDEAEEEEDDEDAEEDDAEEPAEDDTPPVRKKGTAKKKTAKAPKASKGKKSDSLGTAIVLLKDGTPKKVDVLSISAVRAMVRGKSGVEVRVPANEVFKFDQEVVDKLEERAGKIHQMRDSNIALAGKTGLFGSKRPVRKVTSLEAL